ncbi:syntaxin-16 [Phlebotomus argentipes]|uniref:syntaxin-16 n=1 Tax=Phlebotomus argentipes TaxID=94469 RepID=UPI002892A60E|nr:syntaxin-16 [Phlebotomus argentipes]
MASRNLTEVFLIMRNNATQSKNMYPESRDSDAEHLLRRSARDTEEGLEMRDDNEAPPVWIDKLEEAQYTMSRIKPKLEELTTLHMRHLQRPTMDDHCEEEALIEDASTEISKLIASTHRHIQCIRSSLGQGKRLEQRLTQNVVTCLLLQLQDITFRFRNSQNTYLRQMASREERSNVFFETQDFTTIDLEEPARETTVETFDNFLKPKATVLLDESDEQIDEYFQQPVASRLTHQQLLLFEEENTKLIERREQEVSRIVKSIVDLHDIFKDLAGMVQEQGTILDRIDYNVENTQTRVSAGLRQLQRAEMYQRKNRKMMCILILASVTLFLMLVLIFTKI